MTYVLLSLAGSNSGHTLFFRGLCALEYKFTIRCDAAVDFHAFLQLLDARAGQPWQDSGCLPQDMPIAECYPLHIPSLVCSAGALPPGLVVAAASRCSVHAALSKVSYGLSFPPIYFGASTRSATCAAPLPAL